MSVINSGSATTLALPAGQTARFNGFGIVQVVPPVPAGIQRNPIPLIGGRQFTIGPFPSAVTLFLVATSGPMEYFGAIPSDPPPSPGEAAYVVRLPNLATLQALSLANALDPAATYVDTSTGYKYWARDNTNFLSAGLSYDTSVLNYVESGLLPPASGTIAAAALAAGVAYVEANRVALAATPLTLTATRDNYIDLRRDGTIAVTPVTVGAAAPVLAANSMRLGFCTTDATNVTARSIEAADSLGNWMYNVAARATCKLRSLTLQGFGGAPVTVAFPDVDIMDNASMHNPASNNSRIQLPYNGTYAVECGIVFSNALTPLSVFELAPRLNGSISDISFPAGYAGPQARNALHCAGTISARGGQYMEMLFTMNGVSDAIVAAWLNVRHVGA